MKFLKKIIYPHMAVMIPLLPISINFLLFSVLKLGATSVEAIISYVVIAYTLTVWLIRIPKIIQYKERLKTENKYVAQWYSDDQLRTNVSIFGGHIWNLAYALFQLILGIINTSVWYFSTSAYYFVLSGMRYYLVRHSYRYKPGERMEDEIRCYRICGFVFLAMYIAVAYIGYFSWKSRIVNQHPVTAIIIEAYTIFSVISAIVSLFKSRKNNTPIHMASKSIKLASASISLLMLAQVLLGVFGEAGGTRFRYWIFSIIGLASALFIFVSIYTIVVGAKMMKKERSKQSNQKTQ